MESKNGGEKFDTLRIIEKEAINGGGAVYVPSINRIILFSQIKHPPSEMFAHISDDGGENWRKMRIILPEKHSNTQLHFAGSGRFLSSKKCYGRIIRPARVYGVRDGYNNAIYSDDNGVSWKVSNKYPITATGEGSIVELDDGTLLYSSRRHWFENQQVATYNRSFAISSDCGRTWESSYNSDIPDGPKYRNITDPKGPTHQGHYGLMAGLATAYYNGEEYIFYTNVDSNWERKGLSIWGSKDGGRTWPIYKKIHDSYAAYSTIGVVSDDQNIRIVVHFEGGEKKEYEGSFIAIFDMNWLLN